MATKIIEFKKPKLKKPIFIEGLPGVGNVGRIAAGYLIEELKAVKFAELISSHFMPFVMIPQGSTVHMLKNEFYYWKAKNKKQRDLIILIGDSQSTTPEGHYEIVEEILKYDLKKVRKYVRENKIGELIIKTRGFPDSVEKFRKKIKLKGKNSIVMFILRKGDDHIIVFSQVI